MSRFALAAILPPGNTEARLSDLQQAVFASTGNAATLALPPLIPLAAVPPTLEAKVFQAILAPLELRLGFHIGPGKPAVKGDALYLGIDVDGDERDRLTAVTAAFERVPGGARRPGDGGLPFEPLAGFLVAAAQASPDDARLVVEAEVTIPHFSAFHYGLVVVDSADPPDPWWTVVEWEIRTVVRSRRPH